jgi:hypothetical protein
MVFSVLESFTLATFANRLGEAFQIDAGAGQSLATSLIDVEDLTSRSGPEVFTFERAPFSIVFLGPLTPILRQGTYAITHEEIGTFELFIVPIGPRDGGMQYEAVFT